MRTAGAWAAASGDGLLLADLVAFAVPNASHPYDIPKRGPRSDHD